MTNDRSTDSQPSLEQRLLEAADELWDNYVDARDAYLDGDGAAWLPVSPDHEQGATSVPYLNEHQLSEIRSQCRTLALSNEFAINGHENRVNYIVGHGHAYRVMPSVRASFDSTNDESLARLCGDVQAFLDDFISENQWHRRQQEIVRRRDRDGEAFLRLFVDARGMTRIRFVEPDQVRTPANHRDDPSSRFGIQTDAQDVETVEGYWIDGQWTDARQIQHRKTNVDSNVKRGLPLFYPVRKNLRRAEKLLRNMSTVAEIQSAIALIRKHNAGTQDSIRRFVERQAEASSTNPTTGRTSHLKRYEPGTILDAFAGTDYQFPAAAIDASSYVAVLQAELRAIAARLVMPEFMLTSDASNSNYASTMVAEGPAVRMFQRLQHDMIQEDTELMRRAVQSAVDADKLPDGTLDHVLIEAVPPSLAVRDRFREARADEILVKNNAMSVQTMAVRHGLDPRREKRLMNNEAGR